MSLVVKYHLSEGWKWSIQLSAWRTGARDTRRRRLGDTTSPEDPSGLIQK
jgi:hypothetical protein